MRLVLRGPTNSSASGICRWPEALATVTDASSAISVGPLSIDGTQVIRLPPSVPRLRVCTAPMEWAASTSAGNMSRMIGEAMMSPCVASAPMCSPSSRDGDLLEFAQPRDVDDHFRVMDRVLELDQEIGAARQDLGLGAVLAEQRHGVSDIFRHYVSERLHPVCILDAAQIVRCNSRSANRQNGAGIRIRDRKLQRPGE